MASVNPINQEKEITQAVDLCDEHGHLNPAGIGWSRHPLHRCNLSGYWLRKKRWNYWCVTTPEFLFSITLSNIDYLGLAFVYYLDFATQRFIEQTVMTPLGSGCALPEMVGGNIIFENRAMHLSLDDRNDEVHMQVDCPSFGGSKLSVVLRIAHPVGHETLNVVIPWSRNRFQFTSKQNCLPTLGELHIGEETHLLPDGQSFACLDFGRGIWRYRTFWNWGSFSGKMGDRTVGVNLGAGWTDGTGMTENGILVDGVLSKLGEDVVYSYDPSDLMKPWSLKTKGSDRVDLRFTPFFERVAKTDLLVLKSEVHQMIGRFSGRLLPDQGMPIEIDNIIGWVEEQQARW